MRAHLWQTDSGFYSLQVETDGGEVFNNLAPPYGARPEGQVTATWIAEDGKRNSAAAVGDVSNKRKRIDEIDPNLIGHFRRTFPNLTLPLVVSFTADGQAWHFGLLSAQPQGAFVCHRREESAAHDAYEKIGGHYYLDVNEPRPRPPTSRGEPQAPPAPPPPPNAAPDVAWDGEKFVFARASDERSYEIAFQSGKRLRLGRLQEYGQQGVLTATTWKPDQYVWDGVNEQLRYTPAKPHKPRVYFRFRGDGDVGFDGNEPIPPTMPTGRYFTPAAPDQSAKPAPVAAAYQEGQEGGYDKGWEDGYRAGMEAGIDALAARLAAHNGEVS